MKHFLGVNQGSSADNHSVEKQVSMAIFFTFKNLFHILTKLIFGICYMYPNARSQICSKLKDQRGINLKAFSHLKTVVLGHFNTMVINIKGEFVVLGVQIERVKFFTKIVLTKKKKMKIGMTCKVASMPDEILTLKKIYFLFKTVELQQNSM